MKWFDPFLCLKFRFQRFSFYFRFLFFSFFTNFRLVIFEFSASLHTAVWLAGIMLMIIIFNYYFRVKLRSQIFFCALFSELLCWVLVFYVVFGGFGDGLFCVSLDFFFFFKVEFFYFI